MKKGLRKAYLKNLICKLYTQKKSLVYYFLFCSLYLCEFLRYIFNYYIFVKSFPFSQIFSNFLKFSPILLNSKEDSNIIFLFFQFYYNMLHFIYLLGILLCLMASVASVIGNFLIKYSFLVESLKPPERRRYLTFYCLSGFFFLIVLNTTFTMSSYIFASMSILAPFACTTIVLNYLLQYLLINNNNTQSTNINGDNDTRSSNINYNTLNNNTNTLTNTIKSDYDDNIIYTNEENNLDLQLLATTEVITRRDILIVIIISIGCIFISCSGATQSAPVYDSLSELTELFYRERFIIYFICLMIIWVFTISTLTLYYYYDKENFSDNTPLDRHSNLIRFLISFLSGSVGGTTNLFAKSCMVAFVNIGGIDVWEDFRSYLLVAGALLFGILQFSTLAKALQVAELNFVVPIYQMFFILSNILSGVFFYNDFKYYHFFDYILFFIGTSFNAFGLILLLPRRRVDKDDKNVNDLNNFLIDKENDNT